MVVDSHLLVECLSLVVNISMEDPMHISRLINHQLNAPIKTKLSMLDLYSHQLTDHIN